MKKEDSVDYYIKTAWHSLARLYNNKAKDHGLTASSAFVLLNISSSEGTAATKIAPLMGLETRSLTRMLKTLEEKGLIYRKPDSHDRRSVRIFLTDQGMEKKGIAIETVKTFNNYLREHINPQMLSAFREVSQRIIELVENDRQLQKVIGQ